MLLDLLNNISEKNKENKKITIFCNILSEIYKNNDLSNFNNYFNRLNIVEKNDILLYGENYPLFKSLQYFNEVPLFKNETKSILFLKNNNLDHTLKLNNLTNNDKKKLGSLLVEKILKKLPDNHKYTYGKYVPKLIFGNKYYMYDNNNNLISLNEFVSKLNMLYKIKKYNKVENCIINCSMPTEEDLKEYKIKLAKSINNFKYILDNSEINYFNLNYNNINVKCQYIFVEKSLIYKIKKLLNINNIYNNEINFNTVFVNIAYNNSSKIDYLLPFFIFENNKFNSVNVVCKVPKLLYYKYEINFNNLDLIGKHVYFGNWSKKFFRKVVSNK